MGLEADSAGVQLTVKSFNLGFDKRTLDFYGEVADAQVKQLLIAETMPGESVAHGEAILAASERSGQNTPDKSYSTYFLADLLSHFRSRLRVLI